MSPERIKELFDSFADALRRLEEALKEDITKSSIIIDGTIQRFEFTFELAWKLLRLMLLNEGIKSNTPRAVLKEAYLAKLIGDGEGWIDMLEDRNKTFRFNFPTMLTIDLFIWTIFGLIHMRRGDL